MSSEVAVDEIVKLYEQFVSNVEESDFYKALNPKAQHSIDDWLEKVMVSYITNMGDMVDALIIDWEIEFGKDVVDV